MRIFLEFREPCLFFAGIVLYDFRLDSFQLLPIVEDAGPHVAAREAEVGVEREVCLSEEPTFVAFGTGDQLGQVAVAYLADEAVISPIAELEL